MLRVRALTDAKAALAYYGKSDGGYYLDGSDLRREVGGQLAARLGLSSTPDLAEFERLLNGLDPKSGKQLTAKLVEGRLAGWDITASVPKGVTTALERGDSRIQNAIWEAGWETIGDIEAMTTTRPRDGQPCVFRIRAPGDATDKAGRDARLRPAHPFCDRERDLRPG
jgi:hypothetical protein